MPKDFLTTAEWVRAELDELIESALRFKRGEDNGKPLTGQSVALVFFNPSLRTRASMQVGIYELGGNSVVLEPGGTLLVLQPNFRLTPGRYFDFVDHTLILTDASLVEALEVSGFEIAEKRVRFLPFTSKSKVPKWPGAVKAYLRFPPARWLLGKQTFIVARKPR